MWVSGRAPPAVGVSPRASDRVADQRKRPRAVHVREDVGRQQHHRRAAGSGIPLDALERMREVGADEHDVGGIEVDRERLLGACEGGVGETLVVRGVPHALRDERARRTRTADHQDPHRSASFAPFL